ncbi:MAG: glucose-6-phosphate dehydrogenase, partial [Bacteroidetes bacterium]
MLDSHLFIVFGATGDLMHRKLLPALYDLLLQDAASGQYAILGTSRSQLSDEEFRAQAREAMREHGLTKKEAERWCSAHLQFQSLGEQSEADYQALADRIEALEKEYDLAGNRVFYLALPPQAFEDTLTKLGQVGLNRSEKGWTRIVVEKPFGHDLASARELNDLIHRYFAEDQVYRIDHYLGKETVQNLMVFRFGNAIFESLWNREHVERVDILVAEDLGVGSRAGYYDRSGALQDMIQNHLTQLLTLIAMEAPATAEADAIRHEKIKVLQSIQPIQAEDVVLGQYTRGVLNGQPIPGYREEKGVASDSNTETYVALRLQIANWRWQGVPFVLRTGKCLPRQITRIAVTFRRPPVMLFRSFNGCELTRNVLTITLQPDEGFDLSFEVKSPAKGFQVKTEHLSFRYEDAFGPLPDAYRTLLEDIVNGDQTLFVHAQEVEASWKLYTPIIEQRLPVYFYSAGTWGPTEAQRLLTDAPPDA